MPVIKKKLSTSRKKPLKIQGFFFKNGDINDFTNWSN